MPDLRTAATPWFLVIALGALASACAASPAARVSKSAPAPMDTAMAAPAPEEEAPVAPVTTAPPTVESAEQDMASAESALEAALGKGDDPQAAKALKDSGGPPRAAAQNSGDGPCATACRAFASMGRAAGHLCSLAGEADPRCGAARERLRGAAERLKNACPACDAP